MKVCIAEKPSVAREIAQVIGAKSRKDGYFEGNGYQVTWTFGHFCTLYPPEDYDPTWKRWDLYTLPMLPKRFETKVLSDNGVKKQFKVIRDLVKKAQVVINCGDAGQEGELIQRWVLKQADYKGVVQRLWISSLTTESIQNGFDHLKPAEDFDNLYYAGSSRAIGDWLLGMNATRLYTLKYGGYKQVLSIGRVQTPTLAMLVNRHHEIDNFKPEPYWELQTIYRETPFQSTEGKFVKKEDGDALLQQVTGKDLFITAIEKKEGKEYAPKLFDLTSLQVYCNNKFNLTADNTLKTVQRLYEMKVVTYPRVDTTFLPNDMYPKVPGILKGLNSYSQFTKPLLEKKIRKSSKVFNDKKVTDHHAIIPTGEEKQLGHTEQQVYDIIVRRFLAVFYPDCKVAKTQVTAEVDKVPFTAKGKEILDEGWRALFAKDNKKEKEDGDSKEEEEEGILPSFEKGEHGPHHPTLKEKTTKPPRNYTEASLLRAMETAGKQVEDDELRDLMKANGIGRPSTRASIIETLFRRKYIQRKKKLVVPTEMGIQLIGTIQNELLKSAELTGQWEKQLKEIEEGEFSAITFIANMKKMVAELVREVKHESSKPRLSSPYAPENEKRPSQSKEKPPQSTKSKKGLEDITCPKCGKGTIIKGKTAYGCSQWKAGCDLRLPIKMMGKKLTDKQVQRLVEKKATTKLKGFIVNGEKVEGILKLDEAFQVAFEPKSQATSQPKEPAMPRCPKCKKGSIIKGKAAYGCSEWKKGCTFRFAFQEIKERANGRPLTKALVLEIISQ
ncbi:DNA topoisomerase III [Echinicola strongylocentroti]|uniref:DNA topoisomerase n=1 Tax=Echinicola strongylocentroti TaxID=1795355 RepID=A0A2Z4IF48_9BACT|nr:DNA topoisomerase 3 [Echinicola strongylocentroti]AWW29073.1 DNA topoisomerase III [Echinicola strongylocentroti]